MDSSNQIILSWIIWLQIVISIWSYGHIQYLSDFLVEGSKDSSQLLHAVYLEECNINDLRTLIVE